jgi:cold shock protein
MGMSGVKVSGKVKWFNNAKGFGFINTEAREGFDEDGHQIDFFAHYSAIEMDGYKTLKAGQVITFEIEQAPKGLHAKNIRAPKETQPVTAPTDQQTVKA